MKATDVMTRQVVTVTADATIDEAATQMLHHRVSALPVTDDRRAVVGVISEGDLLRRIELGTERRRPRWLEFIVGPGRLAGDYVSSHTRRVRDVMTEEVITIASETPLDEAVALMERHQIKRLPVVEGGELVGIVSRADLLRAMSTVLRTPTRRAGSDESIRSGILAEIERQPWAPSASVDVTVSNGVVELRGTITDERERQALRVTAENFPGVTGVRDDLVCIEPVSGMVLDRTL
jgi:CBS domain-containing protein